MGIRPPPSMGVLSGPRDAIVVFVRRAGGTTILAGKALKQRLHRENPVLKCHVAISPLAAPHRSQAAFIDLIEPRSCGGTGSSFVMALSAQYQWPEFACRSS